MRWKENYIGKIIFEFRQLRLVVDDVFLNVLYGFEIDDDDELLLQRKVRLHNEMRERDLPVKNCVVLGEINGG